MINILHILFHNIVYSNKIKIALFLYWEQHTELICFLFRVWGREGFS